MATAPADEGMRIVGVIRSIELHAVASKFANVPARQVAKIVIDIERAVDGDGSEINVENLAGLHFQGPAELVPRYSAGERVQITTTTPSGMHIATIRPAPLS
jgi:hypothetical protein